MTTETEPDTITDLMTLLSTKEVEDLRKLTTQDLDKIITYQRRQRVARENGEKVKPGKDGPAVDIKALMNRTVVPKGAAPSAAPASPTKNGFRRML